MPSDFGLASGRTSGRLDAAIAEVRQAIRLKPDDPDIHYNLGHALAQKGDLGDALVELQKAHQLAPDNPDICAAYEKLLKETKR